MNIDSAQSTEDEGVISSDRSRTTATPEEQQLPTTVQAAYEEAKTRAKEATQTAAKRKRKCSDSPPTSQPLPSLLLPDDYEPEPEDI